MSTTISPYIDVRNVSVQFNQNDKVFHALKNVNLQVEAGEFICLLGPSGCGKTTLLNAIAGFLPVTEGEIIINGRRVEKPDSKYITIFQNYGLLPWRTVQKNVELGLEEQNVPKAQRKQIAEKYLDLVGLSEFKDAHPVSLSGGQQQRVAIARGLAVEPDILFMDEPFAALDAITRMKLQDDVRKMATENGKTIIFVTHDIEEAVSLADRIVILQPNPGRIEYIVNVKLPHDRDRTSDDFVEARDKIFDLMKMKHPIEIEYYI